MNQAPINPLLAWGQATDEGRAKAKAADAEKERRVDQAVAQTIMNASQAVSLLQARADYSRLLRFVMSMNVILGRALDGIPDDGGQ